MASPPAAQWRIGRLHQEDGIYCSLTSEPVTKDWNAVWNEKWSQRFLWKRNAWQRRKGIDNDKDNNDHTECRKATKFHIQVAARFKPRCNTNHILQDQRRPNSIVLPLHQRLAIIRMNRNLATQKEALMVLKEQGDWFGNHNDTDETNNNNHYHTEQRHAPHLMDGVQNLDCTRGAVILVDRTKGLREFSFDHVMDGASSQTACFERVARPLIDDFLNGLNATCLAYGQTGRCVVVVGAAYT